MRTASLGRNGLGVQCNPALIACFRAHRRPASTLRDQHAARTRQRCRCRLRSNPPGYRGSPGAPTRGVQRTMLTTVTGPEAAEPSGSATAPESAPPVSPASRAHAARGQPTARRPRTARLGARARPRAARPAAGRPALRGGAAPQHVIFPTLGVVSIVSQVDGEVFESPTVGAEGLSGCPQCSAPGPGDRGTVQVRGSASAYPSTASGRPDAPTNLGPGRSAPTARSSSPRWPATAPATGRTPSATLRPLAPADLGPHAQRPVRAQAGVPRPDAERPASLRQSGGGALAELSASTTGAA